MKVKTYRELYTILLNSLKQGNKDSWGNGGLCGECVDLFSIGIITEEEYTKLTKHLKKNRPTERNKFKAFCNHPTWLGGDWWWQWMKHEPQAREQRILFVETIIKSLPKPIKD